MILEELVGCCIALLSSVIFHTPSISRENVLQENCSIYEENQEDSEEYDGLIHREYEQQEANEAPYYEDGSFVWSEDEHPRCTFCESLRRSFKANAGILMTVVLLLSLLTVGLVYVDLNTYDICVEWVKVNVTLSSHVQTLRIVGMSVKLLPVYAWFPTCVAMLWGFRQFKEHYLFRLFLCAFLTGLITCAYGIIMFDKFINVVYNLYRYV